MVEMVVVVMLIWWWDVEIERDMRRRRVRSYSGGVGVEKIMMVVDLRN